MTAEDAERTVREMIAYVESEGQAGTVKVGELEWPRVESQYFRLRNGKAIVLMMMRVALRLEERLREETPWRLTGFRVQEETVYALIRLGEGEGNVVEANLRNRALDVFLNDRDTGRPDLRVFRDPGAMEKKVEWVVGSTLGVCEACVRRDEAEKTGHPVEEVDFARVIAESARKWGADGMVFRYATPAKDSKEPAEEVHDRVQRKEWVSEREFRKRRGGSQ